MKKDKKNYFEDLEIEDLLRPRCQFHASPDLKGKVMAHVSYLKRPLYRKPATWIAAASICAAILTIGYLVRYHDNGQQQEIVAETVKKIENETGKKDNGKAAMIKVLQNETETPETPATEIKPKTASRAKTYRRVATTDDKRTSHEKNISHSHPATDIMIATVGEMPMASRKGIIHNPDSVRQRIIESRRKAEIAYIEMLRSEIEANEAYITQLMTSENVYNSSTLHDNPF